MAEGQRPTKRERRERARAERREREAAAARQRKRRRLVTVIILVVSIAAVAVLVAVTRQPPPQKNIAIERTAASEAFGAAGCEPVDIPSLPSGHLEGGADAPPPTELYPVRPTSQGQHFGGTLAPVGVSDQPLDERLTTHNLEHGAVVVWYDPDKEVDADAIEEWATERNRAGFNQGRGGAGILVSPYPGDFTSGKAVALRAWAAAIDCDRFDPLAADVLLIERFGPRGVAPERGIGGSGYPDDVLSYADEAPAPEPTDVAPSG